MADGGSTGGSWGNILLVGRATTGNAGQFKMQANGMSWRKAGGGREVEIPKGDIEQITWMRVPGTSQLAVQHKTGKRLRFNGFRENDLPQIKEFVKTNYGTDVQQRDMAVSGRNWGSMTMNGSNLAFSVDGKTAFEVDCRDVGGVQQLAKTDLLIEFAADDTAVEEKDALCEMSFHIPLTSVDFPPPPKPAKAPAVEGADGADAAAPEIEEEAPPPAKVFQDRLMEHAAASTGDPIATFHEVGVLTPRGNFTIEMHATFLRLTGQSADFKIQYSNLVRLFMLPRPNSPNFYAVLTLDSPIRKGQTHYQHIVMQFKVDAEVDLDTNPPPGFVSKYEAKLQTHYSGNEVDIFYQVLKALADVKVARQGGFRSAQGVQGEAGSAAVRCVLRSDDGHLFCLNKVFFFLPKPPTLIRYDEVEQLEFERQSGKAAANKSFDLLITLKNAQTASGSTVRFTNIAQQEFQALVTFFTDRGLKVVALMQDKQRQGVLDQLAGLSSDEEDDYVTKQMRAQGMDVGDSDEEDEDFKAGDGSDAGSSSGSSSDSGSGSDGEGGEKKEKKKEKEKEKKKKPASDKPAKSPKKRKGAADGAEGGAKKKRPKKDKNAPKGALSAYMFFSKSERASVLADNPGIAFGEVGKIIGERWKALSKEDKEPYEAQAKQDKERFQKETKEYQVKKRAEAEGAAAGGSDDDRKSGGGSGSESDGGAAAGDD